MSTTSGNAFADGTATNSAQAPLTLPTPIAFQFSQRLKRPARHIRQWPQNREGSTATKSPSLILRTADPAGFHLDDRFVRTRDRIRDRLDHDPVRLFDHDRLHLTAPIVSPRMSCFCAIQPASSTGRLHSVAAAASFA